ncbi:MAG: RsmB/NOP family class I SAM-dependent RNA methyltransferase [Bacteroidia bacterium]|nr:RsmB/NOP family class I SAM-dependent RNA methyltransferase [Bacteroidia bacterium]
MKFHLNLLRAVNEAIYQVFEENKYADKVLEKVLRSNNLWGARDRAFIAENTYDMVRYWRLIRTVAELETHELNEQNLFTLFGTWQVLKGVHLPNWEEFKNVDPKQIDHNYKQMKTQRKIAHSLPDWLDELGYNELGKQWNKEVEALNETAPVVIRVNTLKTNKAELIKKLQEREIYTAVVPGCKDALVLKERQNLFITPEFKEGLFEVQDASSQLVADYLMIEPGMRIVDACAGAGGKSMHIAALSQNKGRIISLDTEQWKLDEAKKRARRAGVSNLELRVIEAKTIKKLYGTADRLLLDVPCSGIGVLKRNPDAKWKLSLGFIDRVRAQQKEILNDYSKILKPGGIMVYATCSILPSENSQQVHAFLKDHSNYELMEEKNLFPSETGFDGFYMARIKRKEEAKKVDKEMNVIKEQA